MEIARSIKSRRTERNKMERSLPPYSKALISSFFNHGRETNLKRKTKRMYLSNDTI